VKEGIHPKYGKVSFECACGNVIETRSTRPGVIKLDICSSCHPFFTGKEKLVDAAGRVERFYRKYGADFTASNKKKSPLCCDATGPTHGSVAFFVRRD
jgi:large subunit ribosomal protein L31